MYITQYHPRDLIFDSGNNNLGVRHLLNNTLQQLVIDSNTIPLYFSMMLPEVVISNLILKFYVTSPAAFKVAVDQYTNVSENYTVDYYSNSIYINEETTTTLNMLTYNTNIGVITHEYTGLSHKVSKDRCLFRIKSALSDPVNLVALLIKAK